jgi:hypothetical protein
VARSKVSPWGFVGMGALACVLFIDLGTADIAPWWVTLLFVLLWLVLLVIGTRWFVPRPRRVPLLALVGFVVWLVTILFGILQLGWS